MIETAADWLADTKRMIFVPLNIFIFAAILFMVWMGAIFCIGTMADGPIFHPAPENEDWMDYS